MSEFGGAALDIYINTNILIVVAFLVWRCIAFAMPQVGLRQQHTTQLRLLNWAFLTILICPLLAFGFRYLTSANGLAPGMTISLSDIVVAHYLTGDFAMEAVRLETLLNTRQNLTADLLDLGSPLAKSIAAGFLIGLTYFVIRLALGVLSLQRTLSDSFEWRRFGNIHLRLSETVQVPFSARGLRRRYVVMPSSMLAESEDLTMVLGHEFQHLRQGDIEWETFLELLKPIFFWNPAFHLWKREVERLRELSCDQQVLRSNRFNPASYCLCLLRVSRNSLRSAQARRMHTPSVALVGRRSRFLGTSHLLLHGRVTAITSQSQPSQSAVVFGFLIVPLCALTILAALAIQKPTDWSHDRLMLSTIVNLERLEAINSAGFGR